MKQDRREFLKSVGVFLGFTSLLIFAPAVPVRKIYEKLTEEEDPVGTYELNGQVHKGNPPKRESIPLQQWQSREFQNRKIEVKRGFTAEEIREAGWAAIEKGIGPDGQYRPIMGRLVYPNGKPV